MYKKVWIGNDNIGLIRKTIGIPAHAEAIRVGDLISSWAIYWRTGRGQITVWHETNRAAVTVAAFSDVGRWDDERRLVILDGTGMRIDADGRILDPEPEEDNEEAGPLEMLRRALMKEKFGG